MSVVKTAESRRSDCIRGIADVREKHILMRKQGGYGLKLRKALLLIMPFMALFLFSCGLQDYPTYTYELSNGLGEKYLVNYCEQTNYPDNITRVKVFKEKHKISDFEGGAYTGCDSYVPSQVMLICSSDGVDYYYIRSHFGEYIAADGLADLKMNFNMMLISGDVSELKDTEKHTYSKLAGLIRDAVSADEAKKRFSDCGYSSEKFIAFYNYQ